MVALVCIRRTRSPGCRACVTLKEAAVAAVARLRQLFQESFTVLHKDATVAKKYAANAAKEEAFEKFLREYNAGHEAAELDHQQAAEAAAEAAFEAAAAEAAQSLGRQCLMTGLGSRAASHLTQAEAAAASTDTVCPAYVSASNRPKLLMLQQTQGSFRPGQQGQHSMM